MTSATSSSARSLFVESKQRLAKRVQININYIASLMRQITRGSKSDELLSRATRDFVATENLTENTKDRLNKMFLISKHMDYQFDNIQQSAHMLNEISEQVEAMKLVK